MNLLPQIINVVISHLDGQALFLLEAYEYYFDTKSNTEKRQGLIKVPYKESEGKILLKFIHF